MTVDKFMIYGLAISLFRPEVIGSVRGTYIVMIDQLEINLGYSTSYTSPDHIFTT